MSDSLPPEKRTISELFTCFRQDTDKPGRVRGAQPIFMPDKESVTRGFGTDHQRICAFKCYLLHFSWRVAAQTRALRKRKLSKNVVLLTVVQTVALAQEFESKDADPLGILGNSAS